MSSGTNLSENDLLGGNALELRKLVLVLPDALLPEDSLLLLVETGFGSS